MSHLRVLICRVDDDDQMTELASADLPPTTPCYREAQLDRLEQSVTQSGQ